MRFLFVDRILQLVPGGITRGIKHVSRDDHYLCHDDQGQVCFMPSLIGETLGQLAAWNVMFCNEFTQRPVAGIVSSAQLHRPAYLGETLLLESCIDSLDATAVQYHSIARVGDELVFSIEGALGPLLPMHDFIDADLARQQFEELDRPGAWPVSTDDEVHFDLMFDETQPCIKPMRFDRILRSKPGIELTAEKKISRSASYFPDHFPNKPVLPMTVLLECTLNLAREFVALAAFREEYQIQALRKIKMNVFVHPGDVVIAYLSVKHRDANELVLNVRSEVDGKRVCVLDLVMTGVRKI